MKTLKAIWRELFGLFIDDQSFALVILSVAALAAVAGLILPEGEIVAGAVLTFGSFAALTYSVLRRAGFLPRVFRRQD